MWVPWVKKSSAKKHSRSPSFTFDGHHHSPSLKDINTLFHHPPPLSPLHKHSLSLPFSSARSPAHLPLSASLKDIHSLLLDDRPPRPDSPPSARKPSVFHRVRTWASRQPPPPDSQNRVVVYYTSLRVVRRTYEDCKAVRSILKGLRVGVDERDLSVDPSYVEELRSITPSSKKATVTTLTGLPRVYVKGKLVGGAEEIRRLHESGELKRMVEGMPAAEGGVCGGCGGFRYVVCEWCDGSHRVYVDEKHGFKCCGMCNANGLIRCGFCTTVHF